MTDEITIPVNITEREAAIVPQLVAILAKQGGVTLNSADEQIKFWQDMKAFEAKMAEAQKAFLPAPPVG